VGGGNERTNIEITRRLLELLGKGETLIRYVEDRPGHDRRYALDTTKIRQLGYKPSASFEERLAETTRWYESHESWWRKIREGNRDYSEFMDRWYQNRRQAVTADITAS
jgi:dTDP-glucose 4,6-dehydratase